ncbi:MAG: TerC family protein [Rhodospirillales bacterium]|nr:TerC family protein [Rhodospirillales bacterium]
MVELLSAEALTALAAVILIDVALAGDNAIVVGMAAAGLPHQQRRRAIVVGVFAAAVLRIIFSLFTVQLLQIIGLLLAGGLLLLWVSWKLWRELRAGSFASSEDEAEAVLEDQVPDAPPEKSFRDAVTQIVVADVSMSLDNVLAVAGAARDHEVVLIFGLILSVALMGAAATLIARLLHRYPWIAYAGFAIILYVALRMIWDGGREVLTALGAG